MYSSAILIKVARCAASMPNFDDVRSLNDASDQKDTELLLYWGAGCFEGHTSR